MARITVEDCIENVPNHFDLVQMAAIRAKQLKKGANALLVKTVGEQKAIEFEEKALKALEIASSVGRQGDKERNGQYVWPRLYQVNIMLLFLRLPLRCLYSSQKNSSLHSPYLAQGEEYLASVAP